MSETLEKARRQFEEGEFKSACGTLSGVPQLIPPIVHETYGICRKKAPHGANTACIYAEREAGTPSGGRRKLRDAGRLG